MKWVELIRLRASAHTLAAVLPGLEAQVAELHRTHTGVEAMLLEHALYDGDLAVVIVWHSATTPKESRPGLLLADQLRTLGSVDHAVWTPHRSSTHTLSA